MSLHEVLEEAIRLRDDGRPELSLALLDQAEAEGHRDGWLTDNRARALVQLQRHEEAKRLWTDLESSEDLALRTAALQNLQALALESGMSGFHTEVQALPRELS